MQKIQRIITLETNDVPNIKDRWGDSMSCYIFPSCTKLFVAVSGPKLAQRWKLVQLSLFRCGAAGSCCTHRVS